MLPFILVLIAMNMVGYNSVVVLGLGHLQDT